MAQETNTGAAVLWGHHAGANDDSIAAIELGSNHGMTPPSLSIVNPLEGLGCIDMRATGSSVTILPGAQCQIGIVKMATDTSMTILPGAILVGTVDIEPINPNSHIQYEVLGDGTTVFTCVSDL